MSWHTESGRCDKWLESKAVMQGERFSAQQLSPAFETEVSYQTELLVGRLLQFGFQGGFGDKLGGFSGVG
jgi:hypothetical protein